MLFLFPAMGVEVFAEVFLLPKLELFWEEADLVGSRVQWLIPASALVNPFYIVAAVLTATVLVLEKWSGWWRLRRVFLVTLVVWAVNTAVLFNLARMLTAALLAIPKALAG